MEKLNNDLPFNPAKPKIMHVDFNSCFASLEQQANPLYRGKPLVVAAYPTDKGCILASSVEAKKMGIKTGMRVFEGKKIYPDLVVLGSDPGKYRLAHLRLKKILTDYSDKVIPKSIDEFCIDFSNFPEGKIEMLRVAGEIKRRIKEEIGDFLTVSIGIGPNRFLAKTAAGLKKPDGLEVIDFTNYLNVFSSLKLTDLCGIKNRNQRRLFSQRIYSVLDFYNAGSRKLRSAFGSIFGHFWYLRLHGWEVDAFLSKRKSFGNSFVIPRPLCDQKEVLAVLRKLVEKTASRMRFVKNSCQTVGVSIVFADGTFWQKSKNFGRPIRVAEDIYRETSLLVSQNWTGKPVRTVAECCANLSADEPLQMSLFTNEIKKESLAKAVDKVNNRWGEFSLIPASILTIKNYAPDRIAFGGVRELNESVAADV